VTRAEEFEELRPLLFAIAYRILGSVSEAQDAVQETWLCYEASPTQPTSTKAFLSAVVTRISINVLRSARVRREQYVGQWFPEPLLTDPYDGRLPGAGHSHAGVGTGLLSAGKAATHRGDVGDVLAGLLAGVWVVPSLNSLTNAGSARSPTAAPEADPG
jgi:DNA-directed RNA polymerase specialized sigma24 family protein